MELLIVLFWLVVIVAGIWGAAGANTMRLNNLRRPDGSYADYDFPGIFNDGNPAEILEPDLKGPGPHQSKEAAQVDLYGRPLAPEVAEKRSAETSRPVQTVFVLQHTTDEDAQAKLLGVYGTRDKANAAIEHYRTLEGFAKYPDGFHLEMYELDKEHWQEGFVA